METVLRQDCSEVNLRANAPPGFPRSVELFKHERNDENTLIAYCDQKNCNTKDFIETGMKKLSKDEWALIKDRKGMFNTNMTMVIFKHFGISFFTESFA